MHKIKTQPPLEPAQNVVGASLRETGFLAGIKRRGIEIAGTAALIAAIGLFSIGATGCERKEPTPPPDSQKTKQTVAFQQRKEILTQRARKLQQDSREIDRLRRQGIMGANERVFRFGDMIIGEKEEPLWHRMVRENSSGRANHSEDDIARAMVDAVKRINRDMYKTKTDRQVSLDEQEFDLLREQLGDKLISSIIEETTAGKK